MASIILRTLSPQIHRALKARAALSGRTVEAEIVEIVEVAVRGKVAAPGGFNFGDIIRHLGPGGPPKIGPASGS